MSSIDGLQRSFEAINIESSGSRGRRSTSSHIQQKLLYVDALNFGDDYFPIFKPWNITKSFKSVQKFVEASRRGGYLIKVFIDDSAPSTEAMKKYRSRREKEVKDGKKNVPHGMSILLGEMFRACNIEVMFSLDYDNDDTLASYAHHDGADVLSNDKDFFRYVESSFKLYGSYDFQRGVLIPQLKVLPAAKNLSSARKLLEPPPPTSSQVRNIHHGVYLRGVPTPLVRALTCSPHKIITSMRRTVLKLNGSTSPYSEEYPEWDPTREEVVWHREDGINLDSLDVDPRILHFLQYPEDALSFFFPETLNLAPPTSATSVGIDSKDWKKHQFCVRSLIFEMCSLLLSNRTSILQYWLDFEASHLSSHDKVEARVDNAGRGHGGASGSRGGKSGGRG